MAKPRKPKNNEDPKPENSGAVVHHQKLCLSIDIDKRQVHGFAILFSPFPLLDKLAFTVRDCCKLGFITAEIVFVIALSKST